MATKFEIAQKFTSAAEGGLTDDKDDRGGITNYGVSIVFLTDVASTYANRDWLKSIGVSLPISRQSIISLTKAQAVAIFKHEFWDRLSLDLLPLRVGVLIYDAAVNHGRTWGVRLAQRGYNATLSNPDKALKEDGILGPISRAALSSDTPALHDAILTARLAYYNAIIAKNPSQKKYERGWKNRVRNLRDYIAGLKS